MENIIRLVGFETDEDMSFVNKTNTIKEVVQVNDNLESDDEVIFTETMPKHVTSDYIQGYCYSGYVNYNGKQVRFYYPADCNNIDNKVYALESDLERRC